MTRPLTTREREVLTALIERGVDESAEPPITAAQRAAWLARVPEIRAGRRCGCGTCPSITLTDADDPDVDAGGRRIVLAASAPEALLLLFVDDDRFELSRTGATGR